MIHINFKSQDFTNCQIRAFDGMQGVINVDSDKKEMKVEMVWAIWQEVTPMYWFTYHFT